MVEFIEKRGWTMTQKHAVKCDRCGVVGEMKYTDSLFITGYILPEGWCKVDGSVKDLDCCDVCKKSLESLRIKAVDQFMMEMKNVK